MKTMAYCGAQKCSPYFILKDFLWSGLSLPFRLLHHHSQLAFSICATLLLLSGTWCSFCLRYSSLRSSCGCHLFTIQCQFKYLLREISFRLLAKGPHFLVLLYHIILICFLRRMYCDSLIIIVGINLEREIIVFVCLRVYFLSYLTRIYAVYEILILLYWQYLYCLRQSSCNALNFPFGGFLWQACLTWVLFRFCWVNWRFEFIV